MGLEMNDNEFERTSKLSFFQASDETILYNRDKEMTWEMVKVQKCKSNKTKRKISTHYKSVHQRSPCSRTARRSTRINGCNHRCYIAIHQIGIHLNAKYNCFCSKHIIYVKRTNIKAYALSLSTKAHLDNTFSMTHHCCPPEFVEK